MKITGVGRYMENGILYYITKSHWPLTRVQASVHWALCDIATLLKCPKR